VAEIKENDYNLNSTIRVTDALNADIDGKHWIGLHHPRMS
jgi:hypothetical protein